LESHERNGNKGSPGVFGVQADRLSAAPRLGRNLGPPISHPALGFFEPPRQSRRAAHGLGYCQYLSPDTILDVGCGEGLLADKLTVLPYRQFVGVDISSTAITNAQRLLGDARTAFVAADAHDFVPETPFDIIIFNQCLYYMPDPVGMIRRYAAFLKPRPLARGVVTHSRPLRCRRFDHRQSSPPAAPPPGSSGRASA
jgi:2-polyprenyl-3-methyl-5-hydroxy-6-metoxy-1,4-benzoquinol methylase